MRVIARAAGAALIVGAVALGSAPAHAQSDDRRVVLVVSTADVSSNLAPRGGGREPGDRLLRELGQRPEVSTGFFSSMQGAYDDRQVFLDISQGSRQPVSLYRGSPNPEVVGSQTGGSVTNWRDLRRRARRVSVTLRPGLLASTIPGGAGFVFADDGLDAASVATDERGQIAVISNGSVDTLVERTQVALETTSFVAVAVPRTYDPNDVIATLLEVRSVPTLMIVAHVPPSPRGLPADPATARFFKLPAIGVAGLEGAGSVTSATTRQRGVVSAVDIAPTVLRHLGLRVPKAMRGERIERDPQVSSDRLESLRRRWDHIRRGAQAMSFHAVVLLAGLWGAAVAVVGGLRRGARSGLRIAGLSLMWWPTVVLLAGPVAVTHGGMEGLGVPVAAVLAAAATDALLRWPRAALVPAAVGVAAFAVDLARGGPMLSVSLLGPSLVSGSRFYGVSNELEPLLPLLALVALAAALHGRRVGRHGAPRRLSRRAIALYAVCGTGVAAVVGAGRLGADVGGVLTVATAFLGAAFMLRGGRVTVRTVLTAGAVALLALVALLVLDLSLNGDSHLDRNLTRTEGRRDLTELVTRRYELARRATTVGGRPVMLAGAVVAVAAAVRNRHLLYDALPGPAWSAALVGGLTGGVVGALTNDSGPVVFINAVIGLAALTAFAQGGPPAPRAVDVPE